MESTHRVVLVVGASSGIGRSVARECARRGDTLVLAARRRAALELTADECRALGAADVTVEPLDVREADRVREVVEGVVRRHGRLDAAVVTAAVLALGRFEDVPADVFDALVRTNVVGTANVAREVLPVLRSRGQGTLVLLGSVLGHVAVPNMTPYVVSKWAVRALARSLGIEGRDEPDVHVCLVEPGAVETPIYRVCANYLGKEPRAPWPVLDPDEVADRVVRLLDRPKPTEGVGSLNWVLRAGFRIVPFAYDRMVGPLFRVLGTRSEPVAPSPGNVIEPESTGAGRQLAPTGG